MLAVLSIAAIAMLAVVSYVWVLPVAWWEVFRQSSSWTATSSTEPLALATSDDQDAIEVKHLFAQAVVMGSGGHGQGYPLLDAIDRLRGAEHRPFAGSADAAALERRARHIVDQSWSERVWLTGRIDQARFDALCTSLEQQRQRSGSDVELVVVRGLTSGTTRFAR